MSVYFKEKPDYLYISVKSMLDQTIKPDEIILVKDGELTNELDAVIDKLSVDPTVKVITLEKNVGLGNALNIGLEQCKNELVARMDTDDISVKDRCEKQLEYLDTHKEISVVGSSIAEFIGKPSNIVAYREVLLDHEDIVDYIKHRNPMNHPSVMYRKSDVIEAGNYQDYFLNEDYFLWVRMIEKDFKFANMDDVLVLMRTTEDTYNRRGGYKYFKTQKKIFDYMLQHNIISFFEYGFNLSVRFTSTVLLPKKIRKYFFLNILRKRKN